MTAPDSTRPRRPRRLALWAPFGALLALILATSLAWIEARDKVLAALASASPRRPHPGLSLSFDQARLTGFPFRLDLDLAGARLSDPSGWAIAAPHVKAEAYLISPGHWVAVSAEGVTVTRRAGGPVEVNTRVLRASLSDLGAHPARISVEGLDLTFRTPPGARPFFLTSAREFHLHTRAGPNDQGAIYIGVAGGAARPEGLWGQMARGGPVNLVVDGIFSHASAMTGANGPGRLKAWSQAGGTFSVRALDVSAGSATLKTEGGVLRAGADGRLAGDLTVALAQPEVILSALDAQGRLAPGAAGAATRAVGPRALSQAGLKPRLALRFEAARVTLGPVLMGRSPRLF